MGEPLFASIEGARRARDGRPVLSLDDRALGRDGLEAACAAHARALEGWGIRPGDPVAVWTHPTLETAVALAGNALYGAVSVPLNASLGERELAHVLDDAGPSLVLAADPNGVRARTPGRRVERITVDASYDGALRPYGAASHEPLLVLYTSGTTGAPKGAVLTHGNAGANLDGLARAWGLTERDSVVHALPLFHVHGLVLGLFGALRAGASLRWVAKFTPENLCAQLAGGGTVLYAVPTMYHRLAEAAERSSEIANALRKPRLLVSGSAALPVREHARIEALTGARVVERYGLTETLINCAVRHDGDRRAGYVGPAVDGVEVRLVDDARAPLPASAMDDATLGEIAVRGPNVFAGYLNRDEATRAVRDEAGWFYTGDLATMAPDGYVRVVGRRATDLLKTGGFKVGAGEVEGALLEHPAVLECAVIGAPDDDLGERIVAFVVLREGETAPDEGALAGHVSALLAPHKRPRTVRFVSELPRNAMGKVRKTELASLLRGGAK